MNKAGALTLPDAMKFYRAIVIEPAWYSYEDVVNFINHQGNEY